LTTPLNPFSPLPTMIVDLTMTLSQSPKTKPFSTPHIKERKTLQWDYSRLLITQYNPSSTPPQMFSHSNMLKTPPPDYCINSNSKFLTLNPFTSPQHKRILKTSRGFRLKIQRRKKRLISSTLRDTALPFTIKQNLTNESMTYSINMDSYSTLINPYRKLPHSNINTKLPKSM
jgi:hypothetical protein